MSLVHDHANVRQKHNGDPKMESSTNMFKYDFKTHSMVKWNSSNKLVIWSLNSLILIIYHICFMTFSLFYSVHLKKVADTRYF